MSATDIIDTGKPLPLIGELRVVDGKHRLIRITWLLGSRAGRTETVVLSPLIDSLKFYAPLRKNAELFATAHIINDGSALAWGRHDAIDMAASSVERLAEESMTADEFRAFLTRNKLSQEAAAAELGRSKRALAYHLSMGFMPRLITLACYGYEARKAKERIFPIQGLPSISVQYELARTGIAWHACVPERPPKDPDTKTRAGPDPMPPVRAKTGRRKAAK